MKLSKATKRVIREMRKDNTEGSYYYAWQSNIAIPIMDRIANEDIMMVQNGYAMKGNDIHRFVNNCAKDFLENLIRDVEKDEKEEVFKSECDIDEPIDYNCELNVEEDDKLTSEQVRNKEVFASIRRTSVDLATQIFKEQGILTVIDTETILIEADKIYKYLLK